MLTAFISHTDCLLHDTGGHHPEASSRLHAIDDRLHAGGLFNYLYHLDAPEVTREQLLRVHDPAYLDEVEHSIPQSGYANLDPDTVISPDSLKAAMRAAGAVVLAVDQVMSGKCADAFCSTRPPGHHAEHRRSMGFCLFNNVAVGAAHALEVHGLERVAVIDFDVHHGNGTEEIFQDDERVLFCSSYQHPFYPYTECREASGHIVCTPLDAKAKGADFRAAVEQQWLPALEAFRPQMILISAGFDAHAEDDISHVSLTEQDFGWVTRQLVAVAAKHSQRRIVSTLEGGYDGSSLGRSVEAHLRALMGV